MEISRKKNNKEIKRKGAKIVKERNQLKLFQKRWGIVIKKIIETLQVLLYYAEFKLAIFSLKIKKTDLIPLFHIALCTEIIRQKYIAGGYFQVIEYIKAGYFIIWREDDKNNKERKLLHTISLN